MNSGNRVLSTTAGALLLVITVLGVVSTFFMFSLYGLDMDLKNLMGLMSFSSKANYIVDLIIVVMLFANQKKFLYIPYIAKTIFPFLNGYIHFEISDFLLFIINIIFIIMLLKTKNQKKNNRLCKGLLISQIILMHIATLVAFTETMSSIVYPISFLWVLISGIIRIAIYLLLGSWIGIIEISPESGKDEDANYFGYFSLVVHTFFLLFTFGIWNLIWIYRTTLVLNNITNKKSRVPLSQLLLCIFVPFYSIYWIYESAQIIDAYYNKKGQESNIGLPCLLLSILVNFVPAIIIQNKINHIPKDTEQNFRENSNVNNSEMSRVEQTNSSSHSQRNFTKDIVNLIVLVLVLVLSVIGGENSYGYATEYSIVFLVGIFSVVLKIIDTIKKQKNIVITIVIIGTFLLMICACVGYDDGVNVLIALCVLYLLIFELFQLFVKIILKKYHATQAYKIKCYKKIEQISTYREKGIITEEEYEKAREQIISKIQY